MSAATADRATADSRSEVRGDRRAEDDGPRPPLPTVVCDDDDDTIEPGTLVRQRTHPDDGPAVVTGVVTIQKWGRVFLTGYELTRGLKGLYPFTHTFFADAADVFVRPGDNPAPAAPTQAEHVGFGEDAVEPFGAETTAPPTPAPSEVEAPLRWRRETARTELTRDGRFSVTAERDGAFSAYDSATLTGARGFVTRYAAELWCRLQVANGKPVCGVDLNF